MHKAVAVVMDPIEDIHTEKDTSFALMLEAQRRGYRVLYVQPGSLAIRDGRAIAAMSELRLKDDKYQYFTEANMSKLLSAGYTGGFHTLEEGVFDYVQGYLMPQRYF